MSTREVMQMLEGAGCPTCGRCLVRIRHAENNLGRVARLAVRPGKRQGLYVEQAQAAKKQLAADVRIAEDHLADHERGAA